METVQEYPKMLYNAAGQSRVVADATAERVAQQAGWMPRQAPPPPEPPPQTEPLPEAELATHTVAELRDMLEARDLPTSGSKFELIARLQAADEDMHEGDA